MRVFERLVSIVRPGDELRVSIKREDEGHVILLTPALREVDEDEKDDVVRNLQALLAVPTRIKVPSGEDADTAVEAYLNSASHAERASAVTTLGDYTDAIREATNAAKTATAIKTKATAKVAVKADKPAAAPSKSVKGTDPSRDADDGADDDTAADEPAASTVAAPVSATPSAADLSVLSLFGEPA